MIVIYNDLKYQEGVSILFDPCGKEVTITLEVEANDNLLNYDVGDIINVPGYFFY